MFVHVNFAAHFQKFRRSAAQSLGHRTDRSDILGDIVAHRSVAARCCLTQPAVFVNERNRNAVHFWLDHHRDFFVRQQALDPGVKIFHFLFRVGVVEAEHRDEMRHLLKRFKRFSADTLSGRIRRDQIGKLRLQIDEFLVEAVVFAVADDWRSFFVVEPVVLADFVSQLLDSLCRLRFVLGHETRYKRANPRQCQHVIPSEVEESA